MSTEEFVYGRRIYFSPEDKFESTLASFQVPNLRTTYRQPTRNFGTWYERICRDLTMKGIPKTTFIDEIADVMLAQEVYQVDYKALQEIPDNRLESEIFRNYKEGDPRNPLGKLGKRFNVVGTTADRINVLVDSWTGLSDSQKNLFRAGEIDTFRNHIIDIIDAI